MFFMRRRRPLLGAAMIGGAGVLAGRSAARASDREADQEQRLEQLEATQQAPAASAPAPAPTGGGQDDLVDKLKELSGLVDSGALTKDEFEAAKRKLLAA
jgi:putative oligomerization/nucleic acid binding protein